MQGGESGIGLEGVRGRAGLGLDRGVRVERLPKNATWAAREQANPAGLGICSAGERGGAGVHAGVRRGCMGRSICTHARARS
jgi:hypothetical protein